MKVELNLTNVLTAVVTALCIWIGSTLYNLDKKVALMEYQMIQSNAVLQTLSEEKENK